MVKLHCNAISVMAVANSMESSKDPVVIFMAVLNMSSILVLSFHFLSTVFHRKVLSSVLPILW